MRCSLAILLLSKRSWPDRTAVWSLQTKTLIMRKIWGIGRNGSWRLASYYLDQYWPHIWSSGHLSLVGLLLSPSSTNVNWIVSPKTYSFAIHSCIHSFILNMAGRGSNVIHKNLKVDRGKFNTENTTEMCMLFSALWRPFFLLSQLLKLLNQSCNDNWASAFKKNLS